jgi:uroporphyrinogen-III synthase
MSARREDDLPLKGIRVLVGRARHQAGSLSTELRKNGAQVIEIPFIEIRKPRSFRQLDSALRNLESYDWLILTSVNGVEAMWERLAKLGLSVELHREGRSSRAARRNQQAKRLRIAAIGPATKKAIEQRGVSVSIVPEQYVAESVVRSLRAKVKGKRVLLVRAKIARDVIPQELRRAGAHVDVVEAYETVVPKSSRNRLQRVMKDPRLRPHVVTFTSSSTVRNFVNLLSTPGQAKQRIPQMDGVLMSSIGPVTSATLREFGFPVQIKAKVFTIPGLVSALMSRLGHEPRS